jgi:anti-anti-sigma regulatory factor
MILPDASCSDMELPERYLPLRRVAALYHMGEALLRAPSEAAVFETAVQSLVEQAHYGNAWILTVDSDAQLLRGRAGTGPGINDVIATLTFPLADPSVHTAIRVACTGEPVVITDLVAQADREGWGDVAREAQLRSAAYIPFGPAAAPLGTIVVSMHTDMDAHEETTLVGLFAMHMTTALARLHHDRERNRQLQALQEANQAQERLLQTVRDLSTPAIPIYDGILVLPLVGNIDTGRAGQIMETVLNGIVRERASVVILDITAVSVIDTGVANHLLQVTQAATLLGARCLLVGIKPEVAHTLVMLGVDLGNIITRADLQSGFGFALAQRGLHIVPLAS